MDGAEEFNELTDTVFDAVLQQCERERQTTSDLPSLRHGGSRSKK